MAIKTNLLDTLYLCIRFKHDATIFSMTKEKHETHVLSETNGAEKT